MCEPAGSLEVVARLREAAARAMRRGAPESAVAYLRRALAETADVSLRATLLHELGLAEKVLADPAAVQHLRASLELASDAVQRAAVVRLQTWLAGLAAFDPRLVGEFDQRAGQLLVTAHEDMAEQRTLAAMLAGILAWRGEPAGTVLALLAEVRGRLALAAGDFAAARAELRSAAATYEALHLLNPSTGWRSALALAADDPDEALQPTNTDLELARQAGLPRPAGIALRTRGMLAVGPQGLDDLREAAEVLAGCGARLEHARALIELGAALRRSNQRTAAREPLRKGLDLAYRCGAGRLAQRATNELRATGARPRRASLTGLEALTPSERRVAELAAGRMSNPEIAQAVFVTLNTVEGHLRHVYQKLSVGSRTQLPAALRSAVPYPPMPQAGRRAAVAADARRPTAASARRPPLGQDADPGRGGRRRPGGPAARGTVSGRAVPPAGPARSGRAGEIPRAG